MPKTHATKKVEKNVSYFNLPDSVEKAIFEYAGMSFTPTGINFFDKTFNGGLEDGSIYLFVGPAKSGKSTILRSLGYSISKKRPVIYANFEQLHRNVTAKLYEMFTGTDLRGMLQDNADGVWESLKLFPDVPFYLVKWTDALDNKAFNLEVKTQLHENVRQVREEFGVSPVLILENLTDIYNERMTGSGDSLYQIAGQTALDIKNFAIKEEIPVLLAHHTPKITGIRPTLDDVRDSKRIADIAHSVFCMFAIEEIDSLTGTTVSRERHVAYIGGRDYGEYLQGSVTVLPKLEIEIKPE